VQSIDLFIAQYGYFAIFGLLMLGIVGPLIPDETILILSGIAVHRGRLGLGPTIGVAFAGSLCGITLSYTLGYTGAIYVLERFGPVRNWVDRHKPQVEKWFGRYGKWTLFFGYFIAGLRHFTALSAGMSRVPLRTLAIYAYPGGLVWVATFVSIGYYLGEEWQSIVRLLDRGVLALVVVAVFAGGVLWWKRHRKPARAGSADGSRNVELDKRP
jgi:membrane protein DedA with SNARE-associated domain